MDTEIQEASWDGSAPGRHAWIDAHSTIGIQVRPDAYRSGPSALHLKRAGQTHILNLDIAWQSVSPIMDRTQYWHGEHLFVKIVKCGMMSIEQRGQTTQFGPGDMAVVDPLHMFNESFRERTCISALRFPKSALHERGIRHRFPMVFRPDAASADVGAVREFVLGLSAQAGKASEPLLARLSDQCLDLMDVLVNDRDSRTTHRTSAATTLRAKQLIARRVGDPNLSVVSIAAEMNISTSCLTRALKANGLSPMRYAWSLRLEHATRLLAGAPQGAIQEIVYQCGFASAAHFSRAFKERYGMTPREYAVNSRAARREGESDRNASEHAQPARLTESA